MLIRADAGDDLNSQTGMLPEPLYICLLLQCCCSLDSFCSCLHKCCSHRSPVKFETSGLQRPLAWAKARHSFACDTTSALSHHNHYLSSAELALGSTVCPESVCSYSSIPHAESVSMVTLTLEGKLDSSSISMATLIILVVPVATFQREVQAPRSTFRSYLEVK